MDAAAVSIMIQAKGIDPDVCAALLASQGSAPQALLFQRARHIDRHNA
ncbi:hypothetical protein GN316_06780 [Xylophilus sp. Kf1]|nr:hypothetical protein [Xylophilus sp. Kf1]